MVSLSFIHIHIYICSNVCINFPQVDGFQSVTIMMNYSDSTHGCTETTGAHICWKTRVSLSHHLLINGQRTFTGAPLITVIIARLLSNYRSHLGRSAGSIPTRKIPESSKPLVWWSTFEKGSKLKDRVEADKKKTICKRIVNSNTEEEQPKKIQKQTNDNAAKSDVSQQHALMITIGDLKHYSTLERAFTCSWHCFHGFPLWPQQLTWSHLSMSNTQKSASFHSYHSRGRPPSSEVFQQQFLPRSSFLINLHASSGVRLVEPRRKEWQQAEPIEEHKDPPQRISVEQGRDKCSWAQKPLKPLHQGVKVVLVYLGIVLNLTRHC